MPRRDIVADLIQNRIATLTASIQNFEFARERLLRKQQTASGAAAEQIPDSLAKNQATIDSLRRELIAESERLERLLGKGVPA